MQMLVEAFTNNPASVVRDANGTHVHRGETESYAARYRNLNVCSWGKYGTFENRQLQGCLNPKMMFAWLSLNRALLSVCSTGEEFAFGEQPLLQMADGMEVAHATAEQMLERLAELSNMPTEVSTLIKSFMD